MATLYKYIEDPDTLYEFVTFATTAGELRRAGDWDTLVVYRRVRDGYIFVRGSLDFDQRMVPYFPEDAGK